MRHRKSCARSSTEGALNEVTRQLCGFNPENTVRINPSLPAVSVPCRTTSTARRCSAYNLYSRAASGDTFLCRRSSASAFLDFFQPRVPPVSTSAGRNDEPGLTCSCLRHVMDTYLLVK